MVGKMKIQGQYYQMYYSKTIEIAKQ